MSPLPSSFLPLQTGGANIELLIVLVITVVVVAGFWKTFEKAGEPGWAAIIPIYNLYVLIKISGNPWWWLILMFIPIINILAQAKISIDVADKFGQGILFGLGLLLLSFIFYPLLGFGDYQYQQSL
ncbi:MAG: signal peptidase I [Halobacteriales archaeon SW_9_67_25]|nr:MAG: signal peptidase I [Halobacteriales archaeon SW_9_67_25]